MTNLIQKGREIGLTPQQVRNIIQEQKILVSREKMMQEVLTCETLDDIKIVLLDWIDKGFIK
jgi:hypothetical protein